jgi:hypothetical protein
MPRLPAVAPLPEAEPKVAAVCPQPGVFADPRVFRSTTKIQKGETAFQTVKRFRLAEAQKNAHGDRLWRGMQACRAKPAS